MNCRTKRFRLLYIMLCISFLLCSCAKDNTEYALSSHSTESEQNQRQTETVDLPQNIILEADLSELSNKAVPAFDAELIHMDSEAAKSLFMSGKKITSDVGSVTEAEDGSLISVTETFLAYSRPFSGYIETVFNCYKRSPLYQQSQKYRTGEDLPFCSTEDAEGQMKDALSSLGIDNVGDVTVYSLDHERLSADEDAFRKSPDHQTEISEGRYDFKGTWTEDDDCYYMIAELNLHGIPVYPDDFDSRTYENILPGNKIECLVNKDGIQKLIIYSAFSEKSEKDEKQTIPCTQALQKVVDKYSGIITNDTYTIADVRLMYVPQFANREQTEYVLIPAWCFSVNIERSDDEKGGTSERVVMINAFTGEEIY